MSSGKEGRLALGDEVSIFVQLCLNFEVTRLRVMAGGGER